MRNTEQLALVQRFVRLPLAQRKAFLEKLGSKGMSFVQLPIPAVQDEFDTIPLSYAQQRQWFLWKFDPSSSAYNIPTALRLKGVLDSDALEAAFNQLITRHQSLRTTFVEEGEQPQQRIAQQQALRLQHSALPGNLQGAEQEVWIKAFVESETQQPFDLASGPLLRVCLLQVAQDEHVLVLTVHHIVADGWSMPVMVEELIQLYAAQREGRDVELAVLPIQYADYAIWQRSWMEAGERERQLAYWTAQLGDEQPVLELPSDRPRPAVQSLRGATLAVPLAEHLSAGLKQLAQQQGVTPFMLLLASFQTLLHRYSGQNDIRVGVPIANRNRVETERLIGFFVNTQILRARFDQQPTFSALLQQVKQASLDAQVYQDLPFDQLVEALHPERSMSHNPLFQVLFNYQRDAGRGATSQNLAGLQVEGLGWENNTAQFDLTLDVVETEGGLNASLSYATDLFDATTVERMAGHWLNLLQAVVATPEQRVGELPLLDVAERGEILHDWNPQQAEYPSNRCIHERITEQAERSPQAIALNYGSEHLTYQQLNSRANQLAHRLIELGVGPEARVGLATERSLEMIVGLLAILKAGGAYVPLDPEYPEDRLSYMMQDSGIALLLTQSHLQERLPVFAGQTLLLGQDLSAYSMANPAVQVDPANLAYIIYTSGSTGMPKGTLLPHHNVMRLFQATEHWFHFDEKDVWTMFHSYAFDFSVWEIFGALMYGGRLVVVPYLVSRSPEDFYQLLCDENVTVLNQTPSAFRQLMHVACAADPALQPSLRYTVFGGEALEVENLRPWFERFGDQAPQLINMYGITETTVHVTYRPLSMADLDQVAASPIGEPIPDLSWYLLDADLNPVARGCTGELYVGRAGLARGYLNRGDLSATRFIPDPFGEQGGRLYRTGDLARYRADGVIEYIGRIDHQVKIRGFRIELGEIEARLLEQDGVREAVVLAQENLGSQQLVAYIVPTRFSADHQVQAEQRDALKAQLKDNLPDYMVPAHVLFLEQLPLTTNGKLDRKALPAPDAGQLQQQYIAPQTALEQGMAAIWQEVLGIEQVGLSDNFFELGGHSLLATQVVAKCRLALIVAPSLRDLFSYPILGELTQHLAQSTDRQQALAYPPLVARGHSGQAPLSLAQRRLWIVEQLSAGTAAYGMPLALRMHGALSVDLLQSSLQRVVERHEILRTSYQQDDEGDPIAVIEAHIDIDMPLLDISDLPRAQQEAEVVDAALANASLPIDMESAPLWRVRILRLSPNEHVLLFSMHHIISDGWSMGVLVNELVERYGHLKNAQTVDLAPLPIQYSDYALWQQSLEDQGILKQQGAYWKQALSGYSGQLALLTDHARPARPSQEGANVNFQLSLELSKRLLDLSRNAGVTPYTTLLTSFQILLHRLTGSDDVLVGADLAGRHQPELEGLIGFFVNVLPLRSRFDAQATFSSRLAQAKESTLSAFEHQDLPFDMIVESSAVPRHMGMNPLVQVLFVMNNLPQRNDVLSGIRIEPIPVTQQHSKFDMALFVTEESGQLHGTWQYATELFKQESIDRFVSAWIGILEQISADQDMTLGEITMPASLAAATPVAAPASKKADKLGQFLKKAPSQVKKVGTAPIRESLLVKNQTFPLLMEPVDASLDIIEWIKANRPLVEQKLGEHAGILFRGFSLGGIQDFEAFAEAVQPGLYGQYGDLPKKEGGKNTYRSTPYPEKKMILFHNESSHQDRWPRKQMFYCEQPSPIGGATPVVDCRQMLKQLPEALREELEHKGLLYVRTFAGKLDVPWQHFFKTEDRSVVEERCRSNGIEWQWLPNDELQTRTWCPAIITHPVTGERSFFNQVQLHHTYWLEPDVREDMLALFGAERMPRHVYFGDGSPIPDEAMQLIGDLYEACAVRFDWQKGDVILLDNMLVAHARDPFEGPRKIVVAMGDMFERVDLLEGKRPDLGTFECKNKEEADA